MKFRHLAFILVVSFCGTAATCRPSIRRADGSIVTLGGSVFTKNTGEMAEWGDGTEYMRYSTLTNDETIVPVGWLRARTTIGLAKEVTAGIDSDNATKEVLSSNEVKKTAIGSAERVESLKITTHAAEAAKLVTP